METFGFPFCFHKRSNMKRKILKLRAIDYEEAKIALKMALDDLNSIKDDEKEKHVCIDITIKEVEDGESRDANSD